MTEPSIWLNPTMLLALWVAGLVTPLLVLAAIIVIGRAKPHWRKPIAVSCAAGLAICVAAIGAKVSFTVPAANVAAIYVIYGLYCLLAFASLWLRRPLVKFVLLGVSSLPMLGAYFLLTVGGLGLTFIYAEVMAPPQEVREMAPGLTCRTTVWGAAFTDEGYIVHLYQTPIWAPFLQREVRAISVDESDPGDGPQQADCEDTMKPALPFQPSHH